MFKAFINHEAMFRCMANQLTGAKTSVSATRKRGRPVFSNIRQNLVDMLLIMGTATGYELAKKYPTFFPACSQRVIYYHLRKGAALGIFSVQKITVESGNFSWGPTSERIFYGLGPNATPANRKDLETLQKIK